MPYHLQLELKSKVPNQHCGNPNEILGCDILVFPGGGIEDLFGAPATATTAAVADARNDTYAHECSGINDDCGGETDANVLQKLIDHIHKAFFGRTFAVDSHWLHGIYYS